MENKKEEVLNFIETSDQICFNIDEYNFLYTEKILILKGWAFSKEIDTDIEFKVDLDFSYSKTLREDVYKHFECEIENALNSGFNIEVRDVKKNTNVVLTIFSGNNKSTVKINIKQLIKLKNNNKFDIGIYKKFLNKDYFKQAFMHLKKFGIKSLIVKVMQVLKRSNNIDDYNPNIAYSAWIDNNEKYDLEEVNNEINKFEYKPLISIIMPVYNVDEKWLRICIQSVINQFYQNWELCIADDFSTKVHVKDILEEYKLKDSRIKVIYRKENGHISKASNSAIEIAVGEYIALLDNDDELPPHALFEVIKAVNTNPNVDLLYSDEDKICVNNMRKDPYFKSDWAPDTLLSCNYISHLGIYRKSIVDKLGGFRVGYEGAQDYDLVLRFSECIKVENIIHIPKILYHWRMIEGSTSLNADGKSYVYCAGVKALEDAVKRRGYSAKVSTVKDTPFYNVCFEKAKNELVSIIIPTKDCSDMLDVCLTSIYENTKNVNFEIIVINNASEEEKTFKLFKKYKEKYSNFSCIHIDIPFNYSILNNEAAKIAKGNLFLFLNNDIKVITKNWLDILIGQAYRHSIGAVGAKLLYHNDTIQHGGVIIGMGGVAGHSHLFANKNQLGYFGNLKINCNYSAVTGACMMIRKSIFFEVDGFDEKLTIAFNDIDLCLKLIKKGYYNLFVSEVELYHYESISRGKEDTPEKIKRFHGETEIMKSKWSYLLANDPCYNKNLSLDSPDFRIKVVK